MEWRVVEALWNRMKPASVRDLHPEFPAIAYTTLMTTLDRLFRKGVLVRAKQGRAFVYRPRLSRPEYNADRAMQAIRVALAEEEPAVKPLLSFIVEAVGHNDGRWLDELERLVRSHRDGSIQHA